MSRIAVFGATGLTGGLVVKHALDQGHEVVALVRDPDRLALRHPSLNVIGGSPISATDVERCLQGADAVIHCLGIGGKGDGQPSTLISDSVKVVLCAMQRHGIPRIVCMSNVGAGGSRSLDGRRDRGAHHAARRAHAVARADRAAHRVAGRLIHQDVAQREGRRHRDVDLSLALRGGAGRCGRA